MSKNRTDLEDALGRGCCVVAVIALAVLGIALAAGVAICWFSLVYGARI